MQSLDILSHPKKYISSFYSFLSSYSIIPQNSCQCFKNRFMLHLLCNVVFFYSAILYSYRFSFRRQAYQSTSYSLLLSTFSPSCDRNGLHFITSKAHVCYLKEYFLHISFIIWGLKLGQIRVRNHCREI